MINIGKTIREKAIFSRVIENDAINPLQNIKKYSKIRKIM